MATNKNNSSSVVPISADLSRIVILGISLEVSRFIVRKVLGVLSSAISDIADNKRSYDDVSVDKVIGSPTFARCMNRVKRKICKKWFAAVLFDKFDSFISKSDCQVFSFWAIFKPRIGVR